MSRRSQRLAFSGLVVGLGMWAGAAAGAEDALPGKITDERVARELRRNKDSIFESLLAEIAAARGRTDVSVPLYLDLAKRTRDPRVARRATEIALMARKGPGPDVLEAVRLWAEFDPASEEAAQMLGGLVAGGLGNPDDLENLLSGLLSRQAKAPGPMLLQLNRAFSRYSDKKAVQNRIERLTTPYLGFAEAHFSRSNAALNADDLPGALAAIDKALEVRSGFEWGALLKMQILNKAGRIKDAIAFGRDFVERQPKFLDARYAYARLLAIDKQYVPARSQFEVLVKESPSNGEFGYTYALLLVQLEDSKGAEAEFKRLLELGQPDPNAVKMQLGQLYEAGKRPEEAIKIYHGIEGANKNAAIARVAVLQARGGDLSGARAMLQKQRESRPKDLAALYLLEAQLLRELKKVPDAMALLEEGLATEPEQAELLYEYAMLAEKAGKFELMERTLRKIIALKPEEAQAYNALGYVLADRNERLNEAQALLDKALSLSPDDAFIQDSVGWVLFRKGDYQGAYAMLKRAYSVRQDAEIAAHLGEVLWMMGRQGEARNVWNEAIKTSPDNEELAKVMKRFAQ